MNKGNASNILEISSINAIVHLLENRPETISRVAIVQDNSHVQKIAELASENSIKVDFLNKDPDRPLAKAWVYPYEYRDLYELIASVKDKKRAVFLALDHLQDPQNFGALCRTAEALGIDGVLIPKDRSVTVSAGVYHSSVGSVATLPIARVTNLVESLRKLKEAGFWIVGTGPTGEPPWKTPDFEKKVLVLGAEESGMSRLATETSDFLVQIPMMGRVDSLNVSVAGGILLYEYYRQNYLEFDKLN